MVYEGKIYLFHYKQLLMLSTIILGSFTFLSTIITYEAILLRLNILYTNKNTIWLEAFSSLNEVFFIFSYYKFYDTLFFFDDVLLKPQHTQLLKENQFYFRRYLSPSIIRIIFINSTRLKFEAFFQFFFIWLSSWMEFLG